MGAARNVGAGSRKVWNGLGWFSYARAGFAGSAKRFSLEQPTRSSRCSPWTRRQPLERRSKVVEPATGSISSTRILAEVGFACGGATTACVPGRAAAEFCLAGRQQGHRPSSKSPIRNIDLSLFCPS